MLADCQQMTHQDLLVEFSFTISQVALLILQDSN